MIADTPRAAPRMGAPAGCKVAYRKYLLGSSKGISQSWDKAYINEVPPGRAMASSAVVSSAVVSSAIVSNVIVSSAIGTSAVVVVGSGVHQRGASRWGAGCGEER